MTTDSPMSGRLSDVGGIASVTNIRNTVIDSRVVIPIATFSPESEGM